MTTPSEPLIGVPSTNVTNVSTVGYVDASSTAEFTHTIRFNGIIDRFYARAYPGQELDVEYHVTLIKAGGTEEPQGTVNLVGEASGDDTIDYLVGDNQTWDFKLRRGIQPDDQIRFRYVNNDGSNAHPVHVLLGTDKQGDLLGEIADSLRRFR